MQIFVILTQRHYQRVRWFMSSKVSTNRQKCESFSHFRTHSIDSECGFTVEMGCIDLVTVVCDNVLVALNTAPNSVPKWDRVVRNLVLLQGICLLAWFLLNLFNKVGRVSVDGIATGYGLRGREIESRCERYFLHRSRWAPGPPRLLYNGYRVIHEGKRLGSIINHLPHLGTRVKKVQSYTSTTPLRLLSLLQCQLYVYFYLYFEIWIL